MTPLRRPVRRLTDVEVTESGRTRAIAWEARREGLALRQFGRRTTYVLPWRLAYLYAARLAGEELSRAKAAAKAARRALRRGAA